MKIDRVAVFALCWTVARLPLYAHDIRTVESLTTHKATSSYPCGDRVWVDIHWKALSPGPHVLQLQWVKPDGKIQDESRHEFDGSSPESWGWLDILSGRKRWNPEISTLGGPWNVRIYLDNHLLEIKRFELQC